MNSRDYFRTVLNLSWALCAAYCLAAPAGASAADTRSAKVVVSNSAGKEIEFVTVTHKYSSLKTGNFAGSRTWGQLPDGKVTAEFMPVDYKTGILETGQDWWMVIFKFKGEPTVYTTDPRNFRGTIDKLEGVAAGNIKKAGEALGGALGGAAGASAGTFVAPGAGTTVGGAAGAAGGKKLVGGLAEKLGAATLNSEVTKGFKSYILRKSDEGKVVNIQIGFNKKEKRFEVKWRSPSGDTATYCSDLGKAK